MDRLVGLVALFISLAALWIVAAVLWPLLPEKIPMHFDFSGVPDRWEARSATTWFLIPALGTLIALFLAVTGWSIPWMLRRIPNLVNIPRKGDLLALPEDARRRALSPTIAMMLWIAALVDVMMASTLYGSWRVGTGEWATLPALWPLLLIIAAITFALVFGSWRTGQCILVERAIAQSAENLRQGR